MALIARRAAAIVLLAAGTPGAGPAALAASAPLPTLSGSAVPFGPEPVASAVEFKQVILTRRYGLS
jgi:hypothetical protein